jgi:hypothetical protein
MRRKLILALVAVMAASAFAAPSASASSWLPMWKGKQHARKDLGYIVSRGEDLTMRCWRVSRRAIDCDWSTQSAGIDPLVCKGRIRERKAYGLVLFSVRRSADCYIDELPRKFPDVDYTPYPY